MPKSLSSGGFRRGGLFFAVLRRRRGFERTKKAGRDASHFVDGRQKGGLIRLRRLGETADLPYKLQRSRPNLVVSDRRIEVEKGFDVSAHGRGTHIYLDSTAPIA